MISQENTLSQKESIILMILNMMLMVFNDNFHSVLFENIKHNDRKIYTGYMNNGTVQTFHDFNWSAKSKISGKEYYYPCHCRWEWESNKISKTSSYVDPTGIFMK